MKIGWLLVVCIGCGGAGAHQSARWPEHRRLGEKRISALEEKAKWQDQRIAELERIVFARGGTPPPVASPEATSVHDLATAKHDLVGALEAYSGPQRNELVAVVRAVLRVWDEEHRPAAAPSSAQTP